MVKVKPNKRLLKIGGIFGFYIQEDIFIRREDVRKGDEKTY